MFRPSWDKAKLKTSQYDANKKLEGRRIVRGYHAVKRVIKCCTSSRASGASCGAPIDNSTGLRASESGILPSVISSGSNCNNQSSVQVGMHGSQKHSQEHTEGHSHKAALQFAPEEFPRKG